MSISVPPDRCCRCLSALTTLFSLNVIDTGLSVVLRQNASHFAVADAWADGERASKALSVWKATGKKAGGDDGRKKPSELTFEPGSD